MFSPRMNSESRLSICSGKLIAVIVSVLKSIAKATIMANICEAKYAQVRRASINNLHIP